MSRRPLALSRSIAFVIPLLGLSACVNLAPDYQQPAAPVASVWPQPPATKASSGQASVNELDWLTFFTDARLRDVVRLGLEHNRDLQIATLNIERARAQYGIASADALPSIGADAQASRSRTPASISNSGETTLSSRYTVDLGLTSYEIDFFGKIRNLKAAALQRYLAAQEARRSAQISLVSEIAAAWLQLEATGQQLALARSTLLNQQKSHDLIRRSHALGAESGLTLAQSQTTVDAARVKVAEYETQQAQDTNALTLLTGTQVPGSLLPPADFALQGRAATRLVMPPDGLPSSVLQQRPDVLAAEHDLIAANADIGAARAAFFPSISLLGSAGTASSSLSGLFTGGTLAWSVAPSLRLPIFDGGANRANLNLSKAQKDILLATYEKAIQTAFREVADALAVRATIATRLQSQQSLVASTYRSFQLSSALFARGGGSGFLEVLDAQRAYYAAQQDMITLRLLEQLNRLALFKTLGGGWQPVAASSSRPTTSP
ncbi:efflux transporter outer membrane subunit [Advenella mimigardefordensis]|uniref:OMF lipoprotein efflux transporter, NodT family n=1 Tax=Advenella mimigardefordensis (strain DSM 17166 / LMG 22922 / DPN7) TaxID=1247726 RepID=W0PBG4_ADVMD|nr:efflux transporter outer membrane subunit [Advenella mimigardefordensis]AHG64184.1 OMF lipoprotein efflux transporter, NodT family [Advenella mimigardefordensis DPN7]